MLLLVDHIDKRLKKVFSQLNYVVKCARWLPINQSHKYIHTSLHNVFVSIYNTHQAFGNYCL